jgi:transcriptional regulator with XRE-family HTH domain
MEPASMTSIVGDRVRQLRTQVGWSAQQLADACASAGHPSLTRSTIAKIESGVRQSVTQEELAILAEALNSELADLMPQETEIQMRRGRQTIVRATTATAGMRQSDFLVALRHVRQAANLMQKDMGDALGCGQAKINKIETGRTPIKPADLDTWLRICDVPSEQYIRIKNLALAASPVPLVSSAYMEMLGLQVGATEILTLHSERIPKPLQADSYLLRQQESVGSLYDPASVLLDRQNASQPFTQEHPPNYQALLTEASLRRMPGGYAPGLVADQAMHLLNLMTAYEHVSVQILTYAAAIPSLDTDFTVLKFDGNRRDVVYAEFATEGRIYRGDKLVAGRAEYWHRLQKAALTRDDSKVWLKDLIEQVEADQRLE